MTDFKIVQRGVPALWHPSQSISPWVGAGLKGKGLAAS
jgi:hypothetical protein